MIERQDPQLADAFRQLKIDEPDAVRGLAILKRYAEDWRGDRLAIASAAVETVNQLHRRYATYSAFPGRPIRFLDNLRRDGDAQQSVTAVDVLDAFTRETGLPRVLLDPHVPLDIGATRQWLGERVIGQPDAVEMIVDLLATVKAGLTRPSRPIASLLFIGPTGVGKTEMAKALAEFLFGSKDRLTRFDMSEFADPIAVRRLAGTAFGAEGQLTAKVREQPFSVLLFDEFEKAHPAFFDLMLQVLGEARLTDAGGRLADFRNAVIILTSNLGAESYQAGHPGFRPAGSAQTEAKQHFVREVERFLRPEMFNRLDRLVPFAPLDEATIRQIAEREWDKVLNRDGIRFRGVQVAAADGVVEYLARIGFDPKYGARPLKRAIERELLAPIAHQMNRYSAELALTVTIALAEGKLAATVKPRQEDGRTATAIHAAGTPAETVKRYVRLRRLHQLLERSSAVRDLDNEVYQLEQLERSVLIKQLKAKPLKPGEQVRLALLGRLREVANEVKRQQRESADLEDAAVVAFQTQTTFDPELEGRFAKLAAAWGELLLQLCRQGRKDDQRLTVAIYSEDKERLFAMAAAYAAIARNRGLAATAVQYIVAAQADPAKLTALRNPMTSAASQRNWQKDYLVEVRRGEPLKIVLKRDKVELPLTRKKMHDAVVGLALEITGIEAVLRFQPDAGLHQFLVPSNKDGSNPDVLVETEAGKVDDYLPPERIERRGGIGSQPPRRIYSLDFRRITDPQHQSTASWEDDLVEPLTAMTAMNMDERLMRLVLD